MQRDGHSNRGMSMWDKERTIPVLTIVVLATTLLSVAFVPFGYAVTGYSATTVSSDNSVQASYGILETGFGNTHYPLQDVMKGSFSTKANQDSEITKRKVILPESVTFTFTFTRVNYSSNNSYTNFSNVIVDIGGVSNSGVPTGSGNTGGNVSFSCTLSRTQLESIGIEDGECVLTCTLTIENNTGRQGSIRNSTTASVSVDTGTLNKTTLSKPSGTINNNSSASRSTTLIWSCGQVGTCPSIFYNHVGPDTGTVSLSFTISDVDVMNGASFKVKLGNTTYGPSTVTNGTATVTATGLALTDNSYSDTLIMLMYLNLTKRVTLYHVSITATFNSYNAVNYGEMSGTGPDPIIIDDVDSAIEALMNDNEDLVEEGYTFEDSNSGSHGTGKSYDGGIGVTIASGGDKTLSDNGAIHASLSCVSQPFVLVLTKNPYTGTGSTGSVTITLDGKSCTINITRNDVNKSFIIYAGPDSLLYNTPSITISDRTDFDLTGFMEGKEWLQGSVLDLNGQVNGTMLDIVIQDV